MRRLIDRARSLFGKTPARGEPGRDTPAAPDIVTIDLSAWPPGAIAECLHDGQWWFGGLRIAVGPQMGERNRVTGTTIGWDPAIARPALFLFFAAHGPGGYPARLFRRIVPVADALERADPAFLDILGPIPSEVEGPDRETV